MDKYFHFDFSAAVGTRTAGFTAPATPAVGELALDNEVLGFNAESEVRRIFYIGFDLKQRCLAVEH